MARKTAKKKANRKTSPRKTSPGVSAGSAGHSPAVTIRHYCQGIGDCHLLTFPRPDGSAFRMLIDCGLHSIVTGGTERVAAIVKDIKASIGANPIDVLVVTHEHWDHVSGFTTAAQIFKTIRFGEVWMPWTEKPGDPLAEKLDKYKGQALAALALASSKLAASPARSNHLSALREGLDSLLGFHFGLAGEKVRAARNAAAGAVEERFRKYLEPDSPPITVKGIPNMRIFVLGPPRDPKLLKLEERQDEMYQLGRRPGWATERALSAGFALGDGDAEDWAVETAPFSDSHGYDLDALLAGRGEADMLRFVAERYSGDAPSPAEASAHHLAEQSWRRIDSDWMGIAADLAMRLDAGINNTSLVLAFEFTDTKRVLLFPGDAQIGSWLSWQPVKWKIGGEEIAATDLLARTVYLKVAHHGSQNATPHRLGLDQMTSPDLSAFIPVSTEDAKKAGWHAMPFDKILAALAGRTAGRVIRADDAWTKEPTGKPPFATPSGSVLAVRNEGRGWVELDIA